MFLPNIWLAWKGTVAGTFTGPMIVDVPGLHGLAGERELAVAARLGGEIDDHGAGPHARHHVGRDEPRRRAAGDLRRGDDEIDVLDVVGERVARARRLVLALRARVAARRLRARRDEVVRDEGRAEREHLLARGGTDVERRDDAAEPARGGDRLQARPRRRR